MKASDIISRLRAVVPQYTGIFSEQLSAVIVQSGGVAQATTATAHGLTSGSVVSISGTKTSFAVSSLVYADGIVTGTTSLPHDLTFGYQDTITISGANESQYNGTFTLLSSDNRYTFTYAPDSAPAISPATGTILMIDPLNTAYLGSYEILTTPSTTSFTYQLANNANPLSPAAGSPVVNTVSRITGAVDMQRILDAYTAQSVNKAYAFVVLEDVSTSKDRDVKTDATAELSSGNAKRLRVIEPFSIYVIIPTSDEAAARAARDSIDSIFSAFNYALFGWKIPSSFSEEVWSEAVPTGHSFAAYNGAYYVHKFSYERQIDLVQDDAIRLGYNVAFRDISIGFDNSFDETVMSTDINLDESP